MKFMSKVTDLVTIVVPVLLVVLAALGITGAVEIVDQIQQTIIIVGGAITAISSIWFNKINHVGLGG